MIVDKTADRNRLEQLSVCPGQSAGGGGGGGDTLANQLDWDAQKHDRREI